MPLLRYVIRVYEEDSEDPLASQHGACFIDKIDGALKSDFGRIIEHAGLELYTKMLQAVGAFDRPYQPVPELPKGPVMTVAALDKVLEGQRIQAEREKQYRLAQQLGPAYMPYAPSSSASGPDSLARKLGSQAPHPGATYGPVSWPGKDWGPPPGFPPLPEELRAKPIVPLPVAECDCGGPKGHVPGGFHCRK